MSYWEVNVLVYTQTESCYIYALSFDSTGIIVKDMTSC